MTKKLGVYDLVEKSAGWIRKLLRGRMPTVGIVLTSGLEDLIKGLKNPIQFRYRNIPGFPNDHPGRLVVGKLGKVGVVVMDSRYHYYDGYEAAECVHGVRVMAALGVKTIIIVNAAGAIDAKIQPHSLVVVNGQMNLTGVSPLRGRHDERLGAHHVEMDDAYAPELREHVRECAARLKAVTKPAPTPDKPKNWVTTWPMTLYPSGVFANRTGPEFETEEEVRAIAEQGGTLVGFSMAFEVIAARQMGLRVIGLVCVTNKAAGVENDHPNAQRIGTVVNGMSALTIALLKEVVTTPFPDPPKEAAA